jgi:hypothetical protein
MVHDKDTFTILKWTPQWNDTFGVKSRVLKHKTAAPTAPTKLHWGGFFSLLALPNNTTNIFGALHSADCLLYDCDCEIAKQRTKHQLLKAKLNHFKYCWNSI